METCIKGTFYSEQVNILVLSEGLKKLSVLPSLAKLSGTLLRQGENKEMKLKKYLFFL